MSQIVLSGRGIDIEYIEIANGLCDEIVRTGLSVAELCHLFAASEYVSGRLNDESRIEFEGQKLLDVAIEVTDDEPYPLCADFTASLLVKVEFNKGTDWLDIDGEFNATLLGFDVEKILMPDGETVEFLRATYNGDMFEFACSEGMGASIYVYDLAGNKSEVAVR